MGALSMRWLVFQVLHVYKQLYLEGDRLARTEIQLFCKRKEAPRPDKQIVQPRLELNIEFAVFSQRHLPA